MRTYQGIASVSGEFLEGAFRITELDELDQIMANAQVAFEAYQEVSASDKASFLIAIAEEIEALGNTLVERTMLETGLPKARVIGERGRTMNQLRLFAEVVKKGEWVEPRIDLPIPDRMPAAKPDLRKQLEPVGPVVVFGASNFPLAYSAAGGDTASALASGCSVVVKGHPAHPGCSQLVAEAVLKAAERTNMPANIYQHVHDTGFAIGTALVQHELTKSVAFTGSLSGGKALFDLANQREIPIPVFAEMGSINPVVLLPNALSNDAEKWASTYAGSITLGSGQFCTNPGLLIGMDSEGLNNFIKALSGRLANIESQQMLHDGISSAFNEGKKKVIREGIVEIVYNREETNSRLGGACLAVVSGKDFLRNPQLQTEIFGPYSLVVSCNSSDEMLEVIKSVEGQLTGTIIASGDDSEQHKAHITALKNAVGRIIFNGVPTGVEVCTAMQHGGPYPATTDGRFSAVGPDAIKRFGRPVAYQNWPDKMLPDALKNANPLGIYRTVDGKLTKESI